MHDPRKKRPEDQSPHHGWLQERPSTRIVPVPPMAVWAREVEAAVDLSDFNNTLRDPNSDGSLEYVAANFDNLADGSYNVAVSFDGVIERVAIINKYGEEHAR